MSQPTEPPRSASGLRFPPAREQWERPASGAWISSVGIWGLRSLELAFAVGSGLISSRALALAVSMTRQPLGGLHFVGWFLLCCLAALLAAVPIAWLVRRLGWLAFVSEMLLDGDRLARVQGRPPIWPDGDLDAEPSLNLVHLSDLHIAEGDDVRLVEGDAPAGNRAFRALLARPELAEADALLVTGDITDRGTAASWSAFFEALEARGLSERTLLVPGNHDVMLVRALEPGRLMEKALSVDRFGITQLANLLKLARSLNRTMAGRHGVVVRDPMLGMPVEHGPAAPDDTREVVPFAEAFARVEAEVRPLVESLPSQPVPALRLARLLEDWRAVSAYSSKIEKARSALLALFPIAVPLPGKDAVVFILNSCSLVSRHPAFNAFGSLGKEQYRRLDKLVRCFPQRLRLIGLHHHLVRRGEELATGWRNRVFARFGLLGDWWRLVRFCREQGIRAVLNGHRHLSYELRLPNGSVLLAAPSSTLGDELAGDTRPQLQRYRFPIAPLAGSCVSVIKTAARLPEIREEQKPTLPGEAA